MRSQNGDCLVDRIILVVSGAVLIGGGAYGSLYRENFLTTGLICCGIGVLIAGAGVFLPCRIVRKLTGGF